jgi:hypothetical protein
VNIKTTECAKQWFYFLASRMKNCPYSTIAAGAWYKYLPRTRGIYSISVLCHVCNSLGLLDHPGWRSDSHRGVLDVSRHHRAGTHGDIISYHHAKQDYTILSAVFPNCGFFRIVYAVFLRSLPMGGCSEGTHILAKLRPARGVGHSGRFQLPFGA